MNKLILNPFGRNQKPFSMFDTFDSTGPWGDHTPRLQETTSSFFDHCLNPDFFKPDFKIPDPMETQQGQLEAALNNDNAWDTYAARLLLVEDFNLPK